MLLPVVVAAREVQSMALLQILPIMAVEGAALLDHQVQLTVAVAAVAVLALGPQQLQDRAARQEIQQKAGPTAKVVRATFHPPLVLLVPTDGMAPLEK